MAKSKQTTSRKVVAFKRGYDPSSGSSKFLKIIGEAGAKGRNRTAICNIARTRALLKKSAPESGLNWAFSMMVAAQLIRQEKFRDEKTDKMRKRGAPYVLTAKGREHYEKIKKAA